MYSKLLKVTYLNFILAVLVLLSLCASCSQNTKTDWEKFEVAGKVKSYTEYHYEVKLEEGKWVQGELSSLGSHINYFDAQGNYTHRDIFDIDNNFIEKILVKKEGRKLVEEVIYDANEQVIGKISIEEDTNDKMVYSTFDKDGYITSKGTLHYKNNKLHRQDIKIFSDDGDTRRIVSVFKHNDAGNLSHQIGLGQQGDTTNILKYEYETFDARNNWTKRLDYPFKGIDSPDKIVIRTYEYYED
ncbi:MAG: hypothetical protein AAF617_10115 [Bacteroidota bacterium]